MDFDKKERIIQEFVPGRQITLAHVIANPIPDLCTKLGIIDLNNAIGIFTITPSEAAIIAGDVATKASDVKIGFVDRFTGSLLIHGDVAAVRAAMSDVMRVLCDGMKFTPTEITNS
jgi:ethanolamine utilization protein EutS